MLGGLLISIVVGAFMGLTSLLMGMGFWWSLLIYSGSGVLIFFLIGLAAVLRGPNAIETRQKEIRLYPSSVMDGRAAHAPVLARSQRIRTGIVATEARGLD